MSHSIRMAGMLATVVLLAGFSSCKWCCARSGVHFYASVGSLDTLGHAYRTPLPRPTRNGLKPPPGSRRPMQDQANKLDPLLESWLSDSSGSRVKPLIISFRDTVTLPVFPEPDMSRPRNDSVNVAMRDTAQTRIAEIRAARTAQYAADTALAVAHGANILHVYWLIQAALVEMPLDGVAALAADSTVRYIEPEDTPGNGPFRDGTIPVTIATARDQINSDTYRALGLDYGWVGLIDTGVSDHSLFVDAGAIDPTRIASREDFVTTDSHSDDPAGHGSDPDDPTDIYSDDGHGTASMAILTGECRDGEACKGKASLADYRGVTDASVNSYRVYYYSGASSYVCRDAVVRATEASLEVLDRTLVVELDVTSGSSSALINACNAAYEAHAAVIVAVGNETGSGTDADYVAVPARAHKVLSVAGYEINETERIPMDQRHGRTLDDGRVKPEITAPTGTLTASKDGCSSLNCTNTWFYSGSSGATPYAGGVAILWNNWLRETSGEALPGLVYAFTIVSGRNTTLSDDAGAGPIRMPSDAWAWFGEVEIEAGTTQPIEVEIPWSDVYAVEAAIWWPEEEGGDHSYHELEIVDPGGTSVEEGGHDTSSVFQRASTGDTRALDGWPAVPSGAGAAPLATGKWIVNIARAMEPTYAQKVYYAIIVRAATPPESGPLEAVIVEDGGSTDDGDKAGTGDDGKGKGDGIDLPCWLWWVIWVLLGIGGFWLLWLWLHRRRKVA